MGDAYKCKNCGTVVETLQRCPSCGESAMRPIQSSGDSDIVSDIAESETVAAADTDGEPSTAAVDGDESANPEPSGTDDSPVTEPSVPEESSNPEPSDADDSSNVETNDATAERRRERARRESQGESGLLSWLKSLF